MTATTNLNLTKPTVGADSDVWGNELNGDLDILDAQLVGIIYGLTLSAAGSTGTFGIAAGSANGMSLGSAYTKTTGAWAVGSGNGSLDTGTIANNTWYHVWLIQRPDTGVVDVLVSTSSSSPTMPTNYTRKRRIGSMLTDGSAQWRKFSQNGNEFLWDIPVQDASGVTPGVTTAQTVTLTVPPGVKTNALFTLTLSDSLSAGGAYVSSLDQSDQAAAGSGAITIWSGSTSLQVSGPVNIRTNTSKQVRIRFSASNTTYWVNTSGWVDTRGQ